ncbi:MAG: hypothetical protein NZV14_02900 [Bryobacteraceae bacterium]|nr:hypothetical protein [Bryobacteraceae bacterium]MDW8377082.1 hypothetical protein [Bryobacterales bacterium]
MFDAKQVLPDNILARLTAIRVSDPGYAFRVAQERERRPLVGESGRLHILAADHPARGVTKVGDNALAMADRREYLARILRVLEAGGVDGVMATMDILEELLILDGIFREIGRSSPLARKLLIASLNRGGLAGSVWELDDPMTGPSPSSCVAWRLDGAKVLLRVSLDSADSLKTMLASAGAIRECNQVSLPMFLEPLPVVKSDSGWSVKKDATSIARLVGVASALGDSSRFLWLKLPYCKGFEQVARSTTLPILLLGGESAGDPAPFLMELESALGSGPNVLGALVGRNVLFPGSEDPLEMAKAVSAMIHHRVPADSMIPSFRLGRG